MIITSFNLKSPIIDQHKKSSTVSIGSKQSKPTTFGNCLYRIPPIEQADVLSKFIGLKLEVFEDKFHNSFRRFIYEDGICYDKVLELAKNIAKKISSEYQNLKSYDIKKPDEFKEFISKAYYYSLKSYDATNAGPSLVVEPLVKIKSDVSSRFIDLSKIKTPIIVNVGGKTNGPKIFVANAGDIFRTSLKSKLNIYNPITVEYKGKIFKVKLDVNGYSNEILIKKVEDYK